MRFIVRGLTVIKMEQIQFCFIKSISDDVWRWCETFIHVFYDETVTLRVNKDVYDKQKEWGCLGHIPPPHPLLQYSLWCPALSCVQAADSAPRHTALHLWRLQSDPSYILSTSAGYTSEEVSRVLCEHLGVGMLLKGTSAVLWRCPGTSPCYQNPSYGFVLSPVPYRPIPPSQKCMKLIQVFPCFHTVEPHINSDGVEPRECQVSRWWGGCQRSSWALRAWLLKLFRNGRETQTTSTRWYTFQDKPDICMCVCDCNSEHVQNNCVK